MKKSFGFVQVIGFIFTSLFGVLLHFLYELSNYSVVVAPFSAVNESIWEHMKLLFFPMFVFAIVQSVYFFGSYENFWCVKLAGITVGVALIPIMYYTYTGIFGVSKDWLNIAIFFFSAFAAYWLENKLITKNFCKYPVLALLILCVYALIFVLFTFIPPHLPLFQNPITGFYGYFKAAP